MFITDCEVMLYGKANQRRQEETALIDTKRRGTKEARAPLWNQRRIRMEVKTFIYLILAIAIAVMVVGWNASIKLAKDIPKGHFIDWAYNHIILIKNKNRSW